MGWYEDGWGAGFGDLDFRPSNGFRISSNCRVCIAHHLICPVKQWNRCAVHTLRDLKKGATHGQFPGFVEFLSYFETPASDFDRVGQCLAPPKSSRRTEKATRKRISEKFQVVL